MYMNIWISKIYTLVDHVIFTKSAQQQDISQNKPEHQKILPCPSCRHMIDSLNLNDWDIFCGHWLITPHKLYSKNPPNSWIPQVETLLYFLLNVGTWKQANIIIFDVFYSHTFLYFCSDLKHLFPEPSATPWWIQLGKVCKPPGLWDASFLEVLLLVGRLMKIRLIYVFMNNLNDWPWIHLILHCIDWLASFKNWSLICSAVLIPKTQANHGRRSLSWPQKAHSFEQFVFPLASHTWFVFFTEPLWSVVRVTSCVFWKILKSLLSSSFGSLRVIFIICLCIKVWSDVSISCPRAFNLITSPPGKYWNISCAKRKQLGDARNVI